MATRFRSLLCIGVGFCLLLAGCASHSSLACGGDAESLGYHEGIHGQTGCRAALSTDDAIAYQNGWNEGIQRFCTEESGYQRGCQGAAFVAICPDALASTYLDGYQSGYSLYLLQLEVDAMERTIEAKSTQLGKIWSNLDHIANDLDQSDLAPDQRERSVQESRLLVAKQNRLGAEIDELESEVSARKAQLSQLRHAIAVND